MWNLNLFLFTLLVAICEATNIPASAVTLSQQACYTYQQKQSVKSVPTTSQKKTIIVSYPVVVKSTSSVYVTPAQSTATTITTVTVSTILPIQTDTYTETETDTETDTTTIFTTITNTNAAVTTTTTVTGSVTVVTAPSGFVYPDNGAPKKRSRIEGRVPEVERRSLPRANILIKTLQPGYSSPSKKNYPGKVVCKVLVEILVPCPITIKAKSTLTITASAQTTTLTGTDTETDTVTLADASTTITTTTTTTVTETDTVTSTENVTPTTTATATMPGSTQYAVCGAQNQISQNYQGRGLSIVAYSGDGSADIVTNSAYDCCVVCINTANCAGSAFAASFGNTCFLGIVDTCPAGQTKTGIYYNTGNNIPITVSNGLCGQGQYSSS